MSETIGRTLIAPPDEQPLTARLAAAGSVRRELEDLLQVAPSDADQETYRRLIIDENVAGKRTEASRMKTWTNLKARYLLDPNYAEFRAFWSAMTRADSAQDRGLLCYLMMTRTDRMFREIVLREIAPALPNPGEEVSANRIEQALNNILAEAGEAWRPVTIKRVWQHVLSSTKDFGVIEGSRNRRTAAFSPGPPAIIFAAQLGRLQGLTDRQILSCRWFRLLGLDQDAAIERLYSAAQLGVIRFRKQAEVVELHLPEPGAR